MSKRINVVERVVEYFTVQPIAVATELLAVAQGIVRRRLTATPVIEPRYRITHGSLGNIEQIGEAPAPRIKRKRRTKAELAAAGHLPVRGGDSSARPVS